MPFGVNWWKVSMAVIGVDGVRRKGEGGMRFVYGSTFNRMESVFQVYVLLSWSRHKGLLLAQLVVWGWHS